jgi:DNA-binding NarL/FixJ family response regulator
VVLADDHELIRAGLRAILESAADVEVVAEVSDGREAVRAARELRPDIVVMDINMPGLNGIEATRQIVQEAADAKVIALSLHADSQMIRAMLNAGAMGYLLMNCAPDELRFAVHAVSAGKAYLTPKVAQVVVKNYVRQPDGSAAASASTIRAPAASSSSPSSSSNGAGASRLETSGTDAFGVLTAREREVLQLLAEGHTSKEIAAALHIGAKTVETHRSQLMSKLGLRSVAHLTKYAVREGLTTLEHS